MQKTALITIPLSQTLCSYIGVVKEHKLLSSEKNAIALHHYIDKNYREDITIKEICDILNTSERAVRSSFKKLFGLSPKEYLSQYRLGKFRNSLIKKSADNPAISRKDYLIQAVSLKNIKRCLAICLQI